MSIDLDVLEGLARLAYHDYGLADIAVGGGAKATVSVPAFISAASPSVVLALIAAARERDGLRRGVIALQDLLTATKINCDGSEEQVAFSAGVIEAYDVFRRQSIAPNAGKPNND